MKSNFLSLALVMVAGTTGQMTSCEDQPAKTLPTDPVEIELTLKQSEVVASANQFAFDLFRPVAVGEEPATVEEVCEPFLVRAGMVARTPRGRVATAAAWDHLGLTPPPGALHPALGVRARDDVDPTLFDKG